MICRGRAWEIVTGSVKNVNLRKHMLACEACLRRLAPRFGADAELWGLTGLLHDIDAEIVENDLARHAKYAAEVMLAGEDVPEELKQAILAHCGHAGLEPKLNRALYCVDPTTGLIVAAALMHPSKSLAQLELGSLCKRFREKRFAAGANREQIDSCVELGMEREEFLGECLEAMRRIAGELRS
jgi:putative nucleotidyltransferase with HDIG domain